MKRDKIWANITEANRIIADVTPIYCKPSSNTYYYPKRILDETPDPLRRNIIFHQPLLYCDPKKNAYYDPTSGEYYLISQGQASTDTLRQNLNALHLPTATTKSPIYYSPQRGGKFYYPESALDEIVRIGRVLLVSTIPPLYYDEEIDTFWHEATDEKYFMFETPDGFENRRKLTIKHEDAKIVEVRGMQNEDTLPIYYDPTVKRYFWPKAALHEPMNQIQPRILLTGPLVQA